MANANADQSVSNRESQATRFEINLIPITHYAFLECTPKQETNATRVLREREWASLICADWSPRADRACHVAVVPTLAHRTRENGVRPRLDDYEKSE